MLDMAFRNLELFFRDKTAVIMSLLAEVIIMVLYIIFMRDNLMQQFDNIENMEKILDVWMISGIIGITPVTAAMGAYGVMIEDRVMHIDRDFKTSPLSYVKITASYALGAAFIGIIMSFFVFMTSQLYLMLRYGSMAGRGSMPDIYGMIIIESLSCAAMVILPVSFLKSSNSLAGCCTIFGALIGFMTGIYLPAGSLGDSAATMVKNFPVSHGVMVFRRLMTEPVISETMNMNNSAATAFIEYMGIRFVENGEVVTHSTSIAAMLLCAAVCFIITLTKNAVSERHH